MSTPCWGSEGGPGATSGAALASRHPEAVNSQKELSYQLWLGEADSVLTGMTTHGESRGRR